MYAHVTVTCAYLTYFIVKLISMQKCHVSSIEFLLKLGRGVQEDKKTPNKTNKQIKQNKDNTSKKMSKTTKQLKKILFYGTKKKQ